MTVIYTHRDLVTKARKWLKNTIKCGVVLCGNHAFGEVPDAIGWKNRDSYLVECKVSRADFFADEKKVWRQYPEMGMGSLRYYLVPKGLVTVDELPFGWGLLYAYPTMIRRVKPANPRFGRNLQEEVRLLYYTLRRHLIEKDAGGE